MAKALLGYVGVSSDPRMVLELQALRRQIKELQAELADVRALNAELSHTDSVSTSELLSLAETPEPALT
ncbi:MAG: hypothetical protein ABR520_03190 [Mycobacteriales bacterium]|nr:hypothetical protein [Frankia sp.]